MVPCPAQPGNRACLQVFRVMEEAPSATPGGQSRLVS